jgi:hypothetical protein
MKSELEIAIDKVALRASIAPYIVRSIVENFEAINWQLKPKRSPELPNIPIDACGGQDVGFTAHVLGGK